PNCGPNAPILSVVIVTYRSANDIGGCLRSLPRELLGRTVEVIVVDNASPDETENIVRTGFPWVRFIAAGANLGFSRANNRGTVEASGEHILFLNPDTIVNEAALIAGLDRLRQEPEIGIYSTKLVLADGSMDLACRRSIPTVWDGFARATGLARCFPRVRMLAGYNLTYLPEDGSYEVGAVNGAFMLLPRRHLARIGPFDERFFMYGDDLDLCLRCTRAGLRVVYDGAYSITHLKGQSSAKEYRTMSRELFRGTKQFYLKHFNPDRSRWRKWQFDALFGCWEMATRLLGQLRGHKLARPM
ncbi:MAG TPA: glycosyltransferase family 2 protein, partial [Chthoniobacter sp.]|nr:glycosyltransferase family 2 protein [Chthoniobacter sp.]